MTRIIAGCVIALAMLPIGGCDDPLSRDNTLALRQQIRAANQAQVDAVKDARDTQPPADDTELYLEKEPDRIRQLDEISGPNVYLDQPLQMAAGLDDGAVETVKLSLSQAIRKAVANNIDVKLAQLQPAISQAELARAEAVFDAIYFAEANYSSIDSPRPGAVFGGTPVSATSTVEKTTSLSTGIRKPLQTGGRIEVSTGMDYSNNQTPGFFTAPDPAWTSNITLGISQPLLRNFGSYVNRSQIMLSRNAHRADVLALHANLLTIVGQVEQAYLNLILLRRRLAIQQRLLKMTLDTRDTIFARAEFDVNPVQKAQAQSFVEQRRNDLITTAATIRNASDRLKGLIDDPELPVSSEAIIVPADEPVEVPLEFNLLDQITTALNHRPEIRQALLNIDDASIRQAVADNQRLPLLTLNAQTAYRGLADSGSDSYDELTDANFIDYILGAQFEAPIGNRAAEADFQRTRLLRQSAVLEYRNVVKNVTLEVKQALRDLTTAWQLIQVNRKARRAAAENLRSLLEREEQGEALTPEFLLDLKLSTQQRLADAESREVQSIVDYNSALMRLKQATGTLLEHNQIQMQWPDDLFADD